MIFGISGIGMVGQAMKSSFKSKGFVKGVNLFLYDKFKQHYHMNKMEDLLRSDIVFLALPTLFDDSTGSYNLSALEENLEYFRSKSYRGIVVIKSTIEPGTTKLFSEKYGLDIVHNPEFLTARTAFEDFHYQKHIVLGCDGLHNNLKFIQLVDFYKSNYNPIHLTICSSAESELMKLMANSFYAVKVQFFTEMFLTCDKIGISFNQVKNMILCNNWIHPMHTQVPGPDGQISYGGMCLPKDAKALNAYMEKLNVPRSVINAAINEREKMRTD